MSKCRKVSPRRAVGDPAGGPLLRMGLGHGMDEPLRLRGSAMADPHGRAPLLGGSGVGHAPSIRPFGRTSFCFRGFSRSTEVVSRRFLNRCKAIFDTDTTVLVS